MSKIIIIGGGIAGLTAGIYAQKYGFESEIFEKNDFIGGECTGYNKDGFHIDNCLEYLKGTDKKTELYQLWEDTGVLGGGVEVVRFDSFYTSHFDEKKAVLWRDKERTGKELHKLGRSDGKAIDEFISAVTALEKVKTPAEKPFDMMTKIERIKFRISMMKADKYVKKYGRMSLKEYAKGFQSPILKRFLTDFMDGSWSTLALMSAYADFTSGNSGLPEGSSYAMSQRMAERYKSLGGVIRTNSTVEKINIDSTKATGITLSNGETVNGDNIICACDTDITFNVLIDKKYMPSQLAENYEKLKVQSAFQAVFRVDDECRFIHNTEIFPCREITVGKSVFDRMKIRSYYYEPKSAPLGKAVLQVRFTQNEDDYEYWKELYETDKQEYEKKKMEIAEEIILSISAQYQQINGTIEILDVSSPCRYHRMTGAYKGAYRGFVYSPKAFSRQDMTGKIMDNIYLATQWQSGHGGAEISALNGKFAVQRIGKVSK